MNLHNTKETFKDALEIMSRAGSGKYIPDVPSSVIYFTKNNFTEWSDSKTADEMMITIHLLNRKDSLGLKLHNYKLEVVYLYENAPPVLKIDFNTLDVTSEEGYFQASTMFSIPFDIHEMNQLKEIFDVLHQRTPTTV